MTAPITEPGWYRAGPEGLEYVCGLDEEPEGDVSELVRVEVDPAGAAVVTGLIEHADCAWRQVGPCVYCADHGVRLYQGDLPDRKRTIPRCQPDAHDWDDEIGQGFYGQCRIFGQGFYGQCRIFGQGFYGQCRICGINEWYE